MREGDAVVAVGSDDGDMRTVGAICIAIGLCQAAVHTASTAVEQTLRLRVYPQTNVAPAEWHAAETELIRIYSGLRTLDVIMCRTKRRGRPDPRCAEPLVEHELLLRLSPAVPGDRGVLGSAVANSDGGGRLASIYVRNVRAAAHAHQSDFGLLLGRVTAHEIGHLLLGPGSHVPSGLMKKTWTSRDFAHGGTPLEMAPAQRLRLGLPLKFEGE